LQELRNGHSRVLPARYHLAVLSIALAGILIGIVTVYGFMNFLVGIRVGDLPAISLLMATIGLGIVILHKLGFDLSYKEEVGMPEEKNTTSV
jgi:hypothetical protein